ncbi:hypothetical protein [Thalassobellus sediminis]|uniref:hypothetical protein n=1 Tax=Thalassobellus sediminis TaxID=3367753 RepID=UPI0037931EDB
MKLKINLVLLLIATVFNCSELDKLTEFDITEDFDTTIEISIPDNDGGKAVALSESSSIDISSNEEINKNLDLIQDITINSLTYEVSNFTGAENATITNAILSIGDISIEVSDINLKQSDDNNTVYNIESPNELKNIATYLRNNSAATITLSGELSATPVTFKIKINIDSTFTIDVI